MLELAQLVRERVLPELGSHAGRAQHGAGAGGDVTFAIDELAEQALQEFMADRAPGLALYSEDRGLIAPPSAEHVVIADPIDGTRPAMAGLESACVALAVAPVGDGQPRMRDLDIGCVVEIRSGNWFLARRGQGVRSSNRVLLSQETDIGRMFWAYGFRGRPVRPSVEVLGELIDASSVGGGTFELGSQAFAMTRIVTGQFDAVIEVGSRLIEDVPGMREQFRRVGGGEILNNSPYDLAGPWLCLTEAGGVCSDGWGAPLGDRLLLGSGHDYQMSTISAANATLHGQLVRAVDAGIQRLRQLHG